MEQVGERAQVWTNRILLALFVFCLVLSFELVRPFLSPLVLASFLVAVFHRPYDWLERELRGHKRLASGLATLAVMLLLVLPSALLVSMMVSRLVVGLGHVGTWLGPEGLHQVSVGELPPRLAALLEPVSRFAPVTEQELAGEVGKLAATLSALAPSVVAVSAELLIQLFVLVLAIFYFFADGKALVGWLTRISPLKSGYTRELLEEFYRVAYAMLVGSAAIAVAQGLAAWLGFAVLGIPAAVVWALALAFASFVPALGTALVWVPMTLYLLLAGHGTRALVLVIYAVVVIVLLIDHLLRPLLIKGKMTMHPLIVFVAIFGGVYFFGLVGLLLGPLIASGLITVLRIYARDLQLRAGPPVAP